MLILGTLIISMMGGRAARADQVPGPVRFVPESPDAYVRLEARFARRPDVCDARQPKNLHAAYPGIIEVGRRSDGRLYLVTELDFPRYLKGIAEVPRNWPAEALKAQVVAARTYAAGHMNPSDALARELNYNLCATDACQVYRGLVVERGAWGEAWVRAVDETTGQIIEYNHKPASTFYFSTSDGRTRTNAEGFGGSPLPYLRSVTESDDGASPVSSWTVQMPFTDLAETLRRAGSWKGGSIQSITKSGDTIAISGGGSSISLSVERFRNQLNLQAVCLVPKRYPTPSVTGRPLPQVVPSKWFELSQQGDAVVITGRGWGHGVGMVQWGARGKAERGMPHSDILAFYYGGLMPTKSGEPGRIRIGLAVDIEELTIERAGAVRVEGASVPKGALHLAGGGSIGVGKGSAIAPVLGLDKVSMSPTTGAGAPVVFSFELSDPANIKLLYRGPASGETPPEPRDRGAQALNWDTSQLPEGSYEVTLTANDGVDEISSAPLAVTVVAPSPSPVPSASPAPPSKPPTPKPNRVPLLLAALLVVLASGAFLVFRRMRS